MFRYFERLRQKPRDERKRIATLWAVGVTLIILFAWLPVFFVRLERFGIGERSPNLPASFLDSLREVSTGLLDAPGTNETFPDGEASSSPSMSTASSSEEEARVLGTMEDGPDL